jgi:hypothetical protein
MYIIEQISKPEYLKLFDFNDKRGYLTTKYLSIDIKLIVVIQMKL